MVCVDRPARRIASLPRLSRRTIPSPRGSDAILRDLESIKDGVKYMDSRTPAESAGHIPTLDGLRAIAILLVIASHSTGRHELPWLIQFGHPGVLIFFALSGFLITNRLLQERRRTGEISLRDFYLRRVFRILPPAVTYLAIVAILNLAGVIVCSWPAIRAALLFYTNYATFGEPGWWVGHFWSLSVEEHFYLCWPLLLVAFGVARGWRTAALGALVVCIWRPIDNHFDFIAHLFRAPYLASTIYRTDLIADTLLWGCCLAFFLKGPLRRIGGAHVVSTLAAVIAGGALLYISVFEVEHVTPLLHVLPTLLLAAVVAVPSAPIGRLLETKPMRLIGKLSYSLYIWQQLFTGGNALAPWIALPAMFACALLSYRFIEQPSIRYGRRFIASLRPQPEQGRAVSR
jgi:peptidoglycan/LPS O-acetylase OafA/YrhL